MVAGPVREFVAGGGVVGLGVAELFGLGELDAISGRLVGGVVVAVGDLCTGVGDERLSGGVRSMTVRARGAGGVQPSTWAALNTE